MSEEDVTISEDESIDPIVSLRNEMNAQFNEMKESFKAELSEKDKLIAQLKEQNTGLQRAIVRSAVTDPPVVEKPKTEQELYDEKVKVLADKTLKYMSGM